MYVDLNWLGAGGEGGHGTWGPDQTSSLWVAGGPLDRMQSLQGSWSWLLEFPQKLCCPCPLLPLADLSVLTKLPFPFLLEI